MGKVFFFRDLYLQNEIKLSKLCQQDQLKKNVKDGMYISY